MIKRQSIVCLLAAFCYINPYLCNELNGEPVMTMKIKKVIQYLEQIAPPIYQESYDNSGLLVGDASKKVTGVIVALDCIESIVDEAIEKGCNLIVAHHPLIFSGLKRLTGKNYIEKTVIKAIKNDIAIYAIHTNLDNMYQNGVNTRIAERLSLLDTRVLAPKQVLKKIFVFVPTTHGEVLRQAFFELGAGATGANEQLSYASVGAGTANGSGNALVKLEMIFPVDKQAALLAKLQAIHPDPNPVYDIVPLSTQHSEVGSGMVGRLETPMKPKKFLAYLKERMDLKLVKHTALPEKEIQKIAVCGGAGGFLLSKAKAAKADVFITSDYKYHEYFDANNQILIADIGHYESERFTIDLLSELLSNNFSNFAVYKTEEVTNPIQYFF